MNGHVDAADILPAIKALTDPVGYETQYGVSAATLQIIGDFNGDSQFDNADLQAFLDYLNSGGGSTNPVPEPSTLVLAFVAFGLVGVRRRGR